MNPIYAVAAAVRAALVIPALAVVAISAPQPAAADEAGDESLQEIVILGRGETRQSQGVSRSRSSTCRPARARSRRSRNCPA